VTITRSDGGAVSVAEGTTSGCVSSEGGEDRVAPSCRHCAGNPDVAHAAGGAGSVKVALSAGRAA